MLKAVQPNNLQLFIYFTYKQHVKDLKGEKILEVSCHKSPHKIITKNIRLSVISLKYIGFRNTLSGRPKDTEFSVGWRKRRKCLWGRGVWIWKQKFQKQK